MFNLAGRRDCDKFIEVELESTGLPIEGMPAGCKSQGEVGWSRYSKHCGWLFTRAWSYWVARCETPEDKISKKDAAALNTKWRTEIRVEGFAGGQDVNRDVGSYHINTPAGLKEFGWFLTMRKNATDKSLELDCQNRNKEAYEQLLQNYQEKL